MNAEQAAALRAPFPPSAIGKLPRAGIQLDYIGHAAVCDRLLAVDPEWTWEPFALAANGTPLWTVDGSDATMWIRLTVAGVTRLGVGICKANAFELEKQLISDALRNAAMRFGVALDLWSKEDLQASGESAGTGADTAARPPVPAHKNAGVEESDEPRPKAAIQGRLKTTPAESVEVESQGKSDKAPSPASSAASTSSSAASVPHPPGAGAAAEIFTPGQASLDDAHSRAASIQAAGVDVRAARIAAELPPLAHVATEDQWLTWLNLLEALGFEADALTAKAGVS